MSVRSLILVLFAISLLCNGKKVTGQSTPVPDGRRLKTIVADKYSDGNLLIGGTTGEWAFGTPTGEIMDREFSYVTPENDFKQHQIHPDNNTWSWIKADRWLSHIVSHNQVLRIHGPVSPQCSNWAKDDSRTPEELETNMREYMQALCERYNGQPGIEYLDVVNEIVINGDWHKNKPGTDWEVPWFIIGQDTDENKTPLYIKYAFEIATQYAPDLKLIINQHEGTINEASWNLIKETVAYLRDMDLRVDGIGWQAHVDAGWEKKAGQPDALRNLIDWAFQNNLEFHVTEASAWLQGNSVKHQKEQAETYKAIVDICIEKSANGKVTWNTWHIDDGHTWRSELFPSIFDAGYRPKPAYYAIQLALEANGDYSTPYQVEFKVKNKESGKFIEYCKLALNGETVFTDGNGSAVFSNVTANLYDVSAEKRFYSSIAKILSVYSDTVFTLTLDSTEVKYNVTFHIEDSINGTNLYSTEIQIDTLVQETNYQGNTTFILDPGKTLVKFERQDYKSSESEFDIQSDTTINVKLEKSHASVKFRLRRGSTPVNKALVILNNDSLITNSLGIATFFSLPIDSQHHYQVLREDYYSQEGDLLLKDDTTINLEMTKLPVSVNVLEDGVFKVYPNPACNSINVYSDSREGWLEIFNANGVVVKKVQITSFQQQLPVSGLSNGIYFIRCRLNGYKNPVYRQMVIQK